MDTKLTKQKTLPPDITLSSLKADQLLDFMELFKQVQWNVSLEKLKLLYEHNPETFYVLVDGDGKVVATLNMTPTFSGEYLIGHVVVTERLRGLGLGSKIVMEAIEKVRPFKAVSLLSTLNATEFYGKLGFHLCEPQQAIQVRHKEVNMSRVHSKMADFSEELKNIRIFTFDTSIMQKLVRYDITVHGFDTTVHMKSVLAYCLVLIAENTLSGEIVGYAAPSCDLNRHEIKFDGLFAESEAIALALFSASLHKYPDFQQTRLMMYESRQFLDQFGETKIATTFPRVALGCSTPARDQKCYSISYPAFCP